MKFTERTSILLGDAAVTTLTASSVAVYGLGGVGAACAMDLVRCGVGRIVAIDFDDISESNLNRLCFGFRNTIGRHKTEVFAEFALAVNPDVKVVAVTDFFSGAQAGSAMARDCDAHVDCVDSLNPKTNLIAALCAAEAVFISSMGTAGRLDPSLLRIGSIWKTQGCPLARSVRERLRHFGVNRDFPVVWTDEMPVPPVPPPASEGKAGDSGERGRLRMVQGSAPFVPQAAGHLLASWIVRRLLGRV
jgi:tRNA A37 threonylcarbamoyladenosine dehydratase